MSRLPLTSPRKYRYVSDTSRTIKGLPLTHRRGHTRGGESGPSTLSLLRKGSVAHYTGPGEGRILPDGVTPDTTVRVLRSTERREDKKTER